jgi:hypothetical protein
MFAGDDKNQWLDQVKKEFGSDLSDHNKDNGNGNGTTTTIEIDMHAKESLAKEMKEKNYNLEGVDSRSSKQMHRMNMTEKTGAASTCLVTTKKYTMNFKQQKTTLNEERKKNTLLEQQVWEMEAALATEGISSTLKETRLIPTICKAITNATPTKTITIPTTAVNQAQNLAEKTITQLNLPPLLSTILPKWAA